jgi:uncharacterized membrane protein YraQ (UPF0718 family)
MDLVGFLQAAAAAFANLLVQVIPYFLLGVALGAALKAYVPAEWVGRYLGGGATSVFYASVLGAALPGCACATMPMAEGMAGKARLGTVAAFILISPLLSPITLALTYGMLGWEMTLARLTAPFVGSMLLGLLLNTLEGAKVRGFAFPARSTRLPGGQALPLAGENPTCASPGPTFWLSVLGILKDLTPYFLLGTGIAALLVTLLPEAAIPRYLGSGSGPLAYLLAALVGIPLYVCEGEEVPITYALLKVGLGPGPAFTFLLGSVGTCVPTILMAQRVIGKTATAVYVGAWFLFAIGSGVVVGQVL